jgi:hypothetical protein
LKKPQALIGLLAALGTAIGVLIAVVGLPYGRLNYTAFAGLYHYGGTPAIGTVDLSLDCDTGTIGIQDMCTVSFGPGTLDVDVVIENNTAASFTVGSFNFNVTDPDQAKLDALPDTGAATQCDSNPDFSQATVTGTWACTPPDPDSDTDASPTNVDSFLSAFSAPGNGPTVAPGGGTLVLATIHYTKLYAGPAPATVTLSTHDFSMGDNTGGEVGSCNPGIGVPIPCFPADINFAPAPPTNTPVPTNTAPPTNTFTATATATNTPLGASVVKLPEGNANNVDCSDPTNCKANLWICVTGPCSGPGEGNLMVQENASNVVTGDQNGDTIADGLGAYEFSVEYDNFVIQSVNPCDVVFGPANGYSGPGAGAARGPVDEVNSSAINPDCTPDPGAVNNGTCTMSLILENVIHFGCVTLGQVPGPTGNFTLASLDLIPHPDLVNDIFPGNNNGVVTPIKDNGCELVDVFGHAVVGSINGGLTPVCGDLTVTVRMLEGDINLDCKVDVTDEQAIALRYGAFFGSLLYSKFFDLEPALHDLDIDIKDIQKVFGRDGSTCQNPIPAQTPVAFH